MKKKLRKPKLSLDRDTIMQLYVLKNVVGGVENSHWCSSVYHPATCITGDECV